MIISGRGDESTDLYRRADDFVRTLKKLVVASTDDKAEEDEDLDADYVVDEKAKTATLTARGTAKAERYFNLENLSDLENSTLSHHINQALKAHGVMKRDIDYVVKDGEVIIVDEFTADSCWAAATPRACTRPLRQGEGRRAARKPHPGHHYLPELLPSLRQALRHDRHGPDRGRGVPDHL